MTNTIVGIYNNFTKIDSIATAKEIWSLTNEVEGYEGACVEVEELTTNTNQDIYFRNNDKINQTALLKHCGSGSGVVKTWYGLKNFSDLTQATSTRRPTIVSSGVVETENGEPALTSDNSLDLMDGTLPYSTKDEIISCVVVLTIKQTGEQDHIVGQTTSDVGFMFKKLANDKIRLLTYRSGGTQICDSTQTFSVGDTIVIGGVADRTGNLDLYINGQLETSVSDNDSDLTGGTSLRIGSSGGGTLVSGSSLQFIGFWLTNQSSNMETFYKELSSRFNEDIPNPRTYFGDSPALVDDEEVHGRLVGDISFSEHAKIAQWASRPTGGFGAIDLVNADSEFNNLVTDDYSNFEVFKKISDPTRLMNNDIVEPSGGTTLSYQTLEDGAGLRIIGADAVLMKVNKTVVTSKTRIKLDLEKIVLSGATSIGIGNDDTGADDYFQLHGTSITGHIQTYNTLSTTDKTSFVIDLSTDALGQEVNYIYLYNGSTTFRSDITNLFIYEAGENVINYYDLWGSGRIDSIDYIEKARLRISSLSALTELDRNINFERFDSTYSEVENEVKPFGAGQCYLIDPMIVDSSTLEYYVHDDFYQIDEIYDNGVALSGSPAGWTKTTDGFTLTANPVGKIRADVKLEKEASTYKQSIDEIVPYLLERMNIYNYNSEDFDGLTYTSYDMSWYGKEDNAKTVIDWFINSHLGYMYPDRHGVLRFGQLKIPNATLTLEEKEIIGEPKVFKDKAENLSNYVVGGKNWSPYQQGEIAFGAVAADKITFVKDYRYIYSAEIDNLTDKQKSNPDFETLFVNDADVLDIAQLMNALFGQKRFFYTVETPRVFTIGDHVNVTHQLKGLESGKDMIVISRSLSIQSNTITYTMWG